MDRKRILRRLLKNQEQPLVRAVGKEALKSRFRPCKAKVDEVDQLLSSAGSEELIFESVRRLAGRWSDADSLPVPLFQQGTNVFGPLGLTASLTTRTPSDANDLIRLFLLRRMSPQHLSAVANGLDSLSAATGESDAEPMRRRLAAAQIALGASTLDLSRLVAGSVATYGPLVQDPMAPLEIADWLVTPQGLLARPVNAPELEVARLLVQRSNPRLSDRIQNFARENEIAATETIDLYALYVVHRGPAAVLDESLSIDEQWQVLTDRGLCLPKNAETETVRHLMLHAVGLSAMPRPDGLHAQLAELRSWTSDGRRVDDPALSLAFLKRFETAYERAFVALVATATGKTDRPISEWLGSDGPSLFNELWPKRERRAIEALTFGQKKSLFDEVLRCLENNSEHVKALATVGRAPASVRSAFVHAIEDVRIARNQFAHGSSGRVPETSEVARVLLAALRKLVEERIGVGSPAAPLFVRVTQEHTDHNQWTVCELEDELGRRLQCSIPSGDYLGQRCQYALVAKSGLVLSQPVLVPLQGTDSY